MKATTATKYGVARDETVIGDLFDDVDTAGRHLANVEDGMRGAGLEPDVRLVTIEAKTTYSRPHVYRAEGESEEPENTADVDEAGDNPPLVSGPVVG